VKDRQARVAERIVDRRAFEHRPGADIGVDLERVLGLGDVATSDLQHGVLTRVMHDENRDAVLVGDVFQAPSSGGSLLQGGGQQFEPASATR
jgi:hypothetical protein